MLLKAFGKPVTARVAIKRDRLLEFGLGFRVKFERPGTGRHLHLPEGSKRIRPFRRASVYFFNSSGNFFPKGWIESFGIRFVMDGRDEIFVHGHQLLHGEPSHGLLDFLCGQTHACILPQL